MNRLLPCTDAQGASTAIYEPDLRTLFGAALEAPNLDNLIHFADFAARFRRHSTFNAHLIRIERPGARVVATRQEWASVDRWVIPNAVPILLLWPSAPVIVAFDIEDTGPAVDRAEIGDPFAATGAMHVEAAGGAIERLKHHCGRHPHFRIEFVDVPAGFGAAGSVAIVDESHIVTALAAPDEQISYAGDLMTEGRRTGTRSIPLYRVVLNPRLTQLEQLVTLAHELGHIFLGHLGPCAGDAGERAGWPDRRDVEHSLAELEAEAVAWIVAARAQLTTESARYLARHVTDDASSDVHVSLIERAAGRFERLCAVHYRDVRHAPIYQP